MGQITEVSVTYSRTVNLGNYESERLEVGQSSTVDPDQTAEAVVHTLATEAQNIVRQRLLEAAELRRLERNQAWYGRSARPKVDESDGEEDDPAEVG